MSKTHRVTKTLSHNLDLADHLSRIPHFETSFQLLSMLINDADFMTRQAVQAAAKYIREDVLEYDDNATFNEIADAIAELQLSELTFFEAGEGRPSLIETVQHLAELRPAWIELAQASLDLREGARSSRGNLWAQERYGAGEGGKVLFTPKPIEEQFEQATFKVSRIKRDRQRAIELRKLDKRGVHELDKRARKLERIDAALEASAKDGEQRFRSMAPIYIATYAQILHTDVMSMRRQDENGLNHSTEGEARRSTSHAPRTFATLPGVIRGELMFKCIANAEKFREWRLSAPIDEFSAIDDAVEELIDELRAVLASPAMIAAAGSDEFAPA